MLVSNTQFDFSKCKIELLILSILKHTMKTNNNQIPILFENVSIIKSKITFKHFFLSNYFSKNTLKTQNSSWLSTFLKIKPHVFSDKNLSRLNLKKNKQFLIHSKKNSFSITFSKQNKQTIPQKFLNLYFKRLKGRFHKKQKNMLKKMNFNRFQVQFQKKMCQKQYYEYLKKYCLCLSQLLNVNHIDFLKTNFLWLFSIVFLNKQIHRFIYFYVFSKRTESYFFSDFRRFFLNFYFLNIFLFNCFYDSAKKQHLNNSNAWIFNKYWLFLQPFPYFFHNYVNPVHVNLSFKKLASQSIKNLYFFMIDQTLFNANTNQNLSFSYSNYFSESVLNCFVQNSGKAKISHKKYLMLKTYYLDSYKTNYVFKVNAKKKEKKYFLSFMSTKPNPFKSFIPTLNMHSIFRINMTKKRSNLRKCDYIFLKYYIMIHQFNS